MRGSELPREREEGAEVCLGTFSGTALSLRWVPPGPLTAADRAAVTAIRAFRVMAWYDEQEQPWSRAEDPTIHDVIHDVGESLERDLAAWHCLARDGGGQLTGCARVTPVNRPASSPSLASLAAGSLDDVLNRMGRPAHGQGVELGMLIVHPAHRGGRAASLVVALALATGRVLGRSRAWGFVGTGRGQHRFIAHYGGVDLGQVREFPIHGEEARLMWWTGGVDWGRAREYPAPGEKARLMWCDLTAAAGRFEPLVSGLAGRIIRRHAVPPAA
ncbi:hypothetical protein CTZ27_03840 [Streptomyces griseocarneus]|nr:hypothetical protein CTZ27_03840 [Streptomyces griseocarneus]